MTPTTSNRRHSAVVDQGLSFAATSGDAQSSIARPRLVSVTKCPDFRGDRPVSSIKWAQSSRGHCRWRASLHAGLLPKGTDELGNLQGKSLGARGVDRRPAQPPGGLFGGSSPARRSLGQQRRNHHKVVREHCGSHPQFEALNPLGKTALHAATAGQHGDAALDSGAKALALLEWCTLLVRLALGSLLAAALWNGHHVDAAAFA